MLTVKEGVLDRIEQSFILFKDNFLAFFLPIFLFQLFTIILFGAIISSIVFVNILGLLNTSTDFFTFLNSPTMMILIIVGMIGFILYLLLYIPFLLGVIKSIDQAYKGEEVTYKQNVWYGFIKLGGALKTYWYIFAYIALTPALLFIIGGFLVIGAYYFGLPEIIKVIGFIMGIFAAILFGYFMIYRGTKAKFALYNAVNKNEYTQENFDYSIDITINNWWRIIGNFLLVGLIIGGIGSLITGVISGFGGSSIFGSMNMSDPSNISIDDIKVILTQYIDNFSIVGSIFSSMINKIITLIGAIFIIVFTFLFFKRLEDEYNPVQTVEIMNEKSVAKKMEL